MIQQRQMSSGRAQSSCEASTLLYLFTSSLSTRSAWMRKVFKWCVAEFRRKHLLKLYYRWYIGYVKSNSGCLSAIFCLWKISFKCLAIISQHTEAPLDFPWWKYPCSSLTALRFSGRKSKWESKKFTFKDVLHPLVCSIVQDQPPSHNSFLPYVFPKNW